MATAADRAPVPSRPTAAPAAHPATPERRPAAVAGARGSPRRDHRTQSSEGALLVGRDRDGVAAGAAGDARDPAHRRRNTRHPSDRALMPRAPPRPGTRTTLP